jgi:hypothetical protein
MCPARVLTVPSKHHKVLSMPYGPILGPCLSDLFCLEQITLILSMKTRSYNSTRLDPQVHYAVRIARLVRRPAITRGKAPRVEPHCSTHPKTDCAPLLLECTVPAQEMRRVPDLSLTQHLWIWVARRASLRQPKKPLENEDAVTATWSAVMTEEYCVPVSASMEASRMMVRKLRGAGNSY